MKKHQVVGGEHGVNTVSNVEELDAIVDRIHEQASKESPVLVSIEGSVGSLVVGLGYERSVLRYIPLDGDPPYLVSSNGSNDETEIDFFMDGHHSPAMAKSLISIETAKRAIRTFAEHEALLVEARWCEV